MVFLGFEPGTVGWQAQTNPLSYFICCQLWDERKQEWPLSKLISMSFGFQVLNFTILLFFFSPISQHPLWLRSSPKLNPLSKIISKGPICDEMHQKQVLTGFLRATLEVKRSICPLLHEQECSLSNIARRQKGLNEMLVKHNISFLQFTKCSL